MAKNAIGIGEIGLDNGAFKMGQLKSKNKNTNDTAKTFFTLGRTAANLEKQREELQQASTMNIMQRVLLSEAKMQIKELLHALALKSDEMTMKADSMSYPPLPGGGYPPLPGGEPGGYPALPPEDMGGGMGMDGGSMGGEAPPEAYGQPLPVPM